MTKETSSSQIILYETEDHETRIEVRLEGETVWLSQKQMAELFQKDVRTINEHIQNVFDEREQEPAATIRNFRIVQREGERDVSREIEHYSLDVIISVGYRVKSHRGTQFRIWASERGFCRPKGRPADARILFLRNPKSPIAIPQSKINKQ